MIKNNLLEEHLNSYKEGKTVSKISNKEKNITSEPKQSKKTKKDNKIFENIFFVTYQILEIIFKSILFGITLKTILNKNWPHESTFAVGFTMNYILFFIHKLFKRKS